MLDFRIGLEGDMFQEVDEQGELLIRNNKQRIRDRK